MALVTIQMQSASTDGNFFFVVELDGTEYQVFMKYNERDSSWYMDLAEADGTPIRSGMKLVCNFPFLRTCMATTRPPGEFLALDTMSPPRDPGLEDLDQRIVLAYEEEVSLP